MAQGSWRPRLDRKRTPVAEGLTLGALGLGVAAATEQLVSLMGGARPYLAHALAAGIAAAGFAWVAGRARARGLSLCICAVGGAAIWATSTAITLAAHAL